MRWLNRSKKVCPPGRAGRTGRAAHPEWTSREGFFHPELLTQVKGEIAAGMSQAVHPEDELVRSI